MDRSGLFASWNREFEPQFLACGKVEYGYPQPNLAETVEIDLMIGGKKQIMALALGALCLLGLGFDCAAEAKKAAAKKKAPTYSARELAVCRSPRFVKGVEFYNKHNYREAIANFEYIDAHGGCCQWTHYYLGLCYQGENQVGLAYRHFEWVLGHGKDANLRRYSQFGCDTVTYYAANRTYAGQGGIMGAVAASHGGGGGRGGGGGFG